MYEAQSGNGRRVLGDPRRVIEALRLPRHTYLLVGLLIGHPDQDPQFKPRPPAAFTAAVDTYPEAEDLTAALADDFTPTADVLAHALEWLREQGESYQRCCLIYPTAVFATVRDLAAGLELLRESGAGAVIPVAAFPAPIQRAFVMNEAGRLSMLWPEHELTRTNDLPESYHDAGQFYWLDCDRFLKGRKIYTDDAVGLVLPRYRVVDIDTPEDWQVAEHLFRAFRSAQSRTMEVTP